MCLNFVSHFYWGNPSCRLPLMLWVYFQLPHNQCLLIILLERYWEDLCWSYNSYLSVVFGARALRGAHMVTFLGHELCEMPIWWRFFSQISWPVPIFQTCEANFSKSRTDTDTMFSLKVAQDSKSFRNKFGFMGFFQKKFWKNAIFDNFSSFISYISTLRPNTMFLVS